MTFKTWPMNDANCGMLIQKVGDLVGIFLVYAHAKRQGFETAEDQPRSERTNRSPVMDERILSQIYQSLRMTCYKRASKRIAMPANVLGQ
jgi:hypothetical protein